MGHHFDPFNPQPQSIDIRDIAIGLSNTCRFSGQIPEHYSVAQHSVIMSHQVPDECALEALLHDAAEAYLGDVPRPVKFGLPDYRRLSEIVESAIALKYGLVYPWPDDVKDADLRIVMTEGRDFGRDTSDWGITQAPYEFTIYPLMPQTCADIFMDRFHELYYSRIQMKQNVNAILSRSDD